MTEKEIEIFNELKEFLIEWNEGYYSGGDTMGILQDFHDRLEIIKKEKQNENV